MLWKINLKKGVLIRFPNFQNRAHGTFDASVYTECVDALFKGKFRDSKTERMEFTVSFNTNPFQGRYIRADFISLVLKEKWVSRNLIRLIGTQTDKDNRN